jgi:hypothetical protein
LAKFPDDMPVFTIPEGGIKASRETVVGDRREVLAVNLLSKSPGSKQGVYLTVLKRCGDTAEDKDAIAENYEELDKKYRQLNERCDVFVAQLRELAEKGTRK